MKRVEVLLVTVKNNDLKNLINRVNILSPAVIANQSDTESLLSKEYSNGVITVITTKTKGVGINRNLSLNLAKEEFLLFLDDDMILNDDYENIIKKAFCENEDADIIIFNFDYLNEKEKTKRFTESKKLNKFCGLKYGICATAIRRRTIIKNNLCFSTAFGGGCLYGSGEDSLFFLEAFRKKLKIYTCSESIGQNYVGVSTWFTGFNEKYFYDKGAWISCAFPNMKFLMILYYCIRFWKISECSKKQIFNSLIMGTRNFRELIKYENKV